MKQIFSIAMLLLMTMSVGSLCAQQVGKKKDRPTGITEQKMDGHSRPLKRELGEKNDDRTRKANDPLALIANAFPNMEKIEEDKVWNKVFGQNGELIGYVVFSSSASDSIKGYAGPTPLLIAFNADKTIRSVQMMRNRETPKFRKQVMESKLLESWNGLTVKKAQKKKVDTVSGATFTSKSIIESLQAALKRL